MANESLPYYIDRLAEGSITTSEWQALQDLLTHEGQNKILVDLLDQQLIQLANDPIEYPDVIDRVQSAVIHHIAMERQVPSVHRVHFLRTAWLRYVAAFLLLFGIGTYFYTQQKNNQTLSEIQRLPIKNDILPGGNRAVLTLSDGSTILLDSATNGQIAMQAGSSIQKKDGQVIYDPRDQHISTISYNTMTTPKGGQYQLRLADGTKVWLNAASSITYPTAFAGNNREVKITGEAYFEVTKNKEKPFIVKAVNDEILVLGTSFNVNSYPDESASKTALVEGSVQIHGKVLKPGEAYQGGKVALTNVDQDVAWKNGFFNFNGANIYSVMRQLSRWYNVDIKYEGTIPEITFKGEMERALDLSEILELLSKMGIKYRIEQKTLIITG